MAKLTLSNLLSGFGILTKYNANNDAIEAALENTLSRDGTAPNAMSANLDVGGFRVMNIADAVSSTDAVPLGQIPVPAVDIVVLTQEVLAGYLFPITTHETAAGVTPTNLQYQEFDPRRYDADPTGGTLSTTGVQAAIDVASQAGGGACVDLNGGVYLVSTLTIDSRDIRIRGPGKLVADASIPDNGAIIVSLAGGADETVNQALLDGIYGVDVVLVRTVVSGSLERVRIDDVDFESNANDIRGIWMTGFTRGCRIMGCGFEDFTVADIAINGSWSFSLINNHCNGDGTNGVGIHLGITGNGERSASIVCNAVTMINNECVNHANGAIWNFGAGGSLNGNIFEFNVTDGFASQSVTGLAVVGNYFEENGGDNLDMGGTNGTDFADGWLVSGNKFDNDTGRNIRLDGVKNCRIFANHFGGTVTQHYFIPSSGGANVLQNEIEVPDVSGTYISNSVELNQETNWVRRTDPAQYLMQSPNAQIQGTFRHMGGASSLGFFGHALASQPADISALTDNTSGTADNTLQAIPNPADAPGTADILRDDIVTNDLPAIRNNFADLASQVNDIRTALRALGLMA